MNGFKKKETKTTIKHTKDDITIMIDKKFGNHTLSYYKGSDEKDVKTAREFLEKYEEK